MRRHAVTTILLVLAAAACSDSDAPMGPVTEIVDELLVTVLVEQGDDLITVNLQVRNGGTETRTVQFGGTCNPVVEVYEPGSADEPVWRELAWREDAGACIPVTRNAELVPGATTGTVGFLRPADVLGDSLPAGNYRFVVLFTMAEPEASLELAAGTFRLVPP